MFTVHPPLFQIDDCENATISGVTFRNSPFWNTHVIYPDGVMIHDISVQNPPNAPNGDGVDVDSLRFARVNGTHIDADDNAIRLKFGKDERGREVGRLTENIAVTNCTIEHDHGSVVTESETAGDVRHVTVANYTFTDTDRGIHIESKRGRDGTIEGLRFDTVVMCRIARLPVINSYYQTDIDSDPEPVTEVTPNVRNVDFHHITAEKVESVTFLTGLPEQRFEGISFTDVDIDTIRPFDVSGLSSTAAEGYNQ